MSNDFNRDMEVHARSPTAKQDNNTKSKGLSDAEDSSIKVPSPRNNASITSLPDANFLRYEHTSPGTLQDVTMENSYGIGNRSPCATLQTYQGSTSPATQGRSVREFEEQMATLRKENFNLKLRLYFIEESIPGYQQANSPDSQESLMNQLIDTKVEIEMLRKDVQEKQDLLKEAAQAMNQMEMIQKETEAKSQAIVDELNQKIQLLHMEKQMDKTPNAELMNELLGRSNISENINAIQRVHELEGLLEESNQKLINLQDQICKLDEILQKRDETIKEYEDKVKELAFQNSEMQEALENREKEAAVAESQGAREELYELKAMLADKTCLLQEAEEKLESRTQIHQKACRTIQKLMANIASQQDEINKLKKKDKENISQSSNVSGKEQRKVSQSGLSVLEYTGLSRSMSDTEAFTNEITLLEKEEYEAKIAEQRLMISSLKAEVKKKTANLQNLVNKELWEKNREIERLTKLINNTKECPPVLSPTKENLPANELQQSFTEADYLKAVERNKLLQKKIDILIQRLSANRNNETLLAQLRNDVREARNEAKQAEKWRRECADICSVLSNRLEELANFLNSLLKHKDVLGLLAADRRRAMRKAVDRSLDLSKSLNMTLSITGISMTDQSLLQISNISEILGDLVDRQDRTFNSHEELLRAEGEAAEEDLKTENKISKQDLDEHPNRNERHSLPLIGIDNQSESEAWSEPDRNVSMARIGLEDHSVATSRNQPNTIPPKIKLDTDSDSGDVINRSRSNKLAPTTPSRSLERISQLEQIIVQRDDRILDIQCQLVDVDSSLKKENLKVVELTNELNQLRRQNEELEKKVSAAIDSEHDKSLYQRSENLLRRQIEEKTVSLEKIQEERDRLSVEARVAEIQIGALRSELDVLKRKHEEEITQVREEERQKLEKIQAEHRSILQARIEEQQRDHEDTLARNWIARTLYEESQQQLENLQTQLKEAQDQIEYLRENEEEMKKALIDSELANRSFKKELDESAMQASKAVLERTRALNENLQLKKRVDDLNLQLQSVEVQVSTMQQKIDQLEDARLTLQQELDEANAQLQKLQGSEISRSGYTSEDVAIHNNSSSNTDRSPDLQRQNSSPDLGIESDAARNMSIELSSAEHHKLKAIELQNNKAEENMDADSVTTNNLERLQQQNLSYSHAASHDCQKVDQENIELRRKLIRTKRALEDTYEKLRISNQRKAQIEKDIKNQILKTHNVLRNVRSNMENDL